MNVTLRFTDLKRLNNGRPLGKLDIVSVAALLMSAITTNALKCDAMALSNYTNSFNSAIGTNTFPAFICDSVPLTIIGAGAGLAAGYGISTSSSVSREFSPGIIAGFVMSGVVTFFIIIFVLTKIRRQRRRKQHQQQQQQSSSLLSLSPSKSNIHSKDIDFIQENPLLQSSRTAAIPLPVPVIRHLAVSSTSSSNISPNSSISQKEELRREMETMWPLNSVRLSSRSSMSPTTTTTTSPIPPTPPSLSPRTSSKGIREEDDESSFFDSPIGQGQLAHAISSSFIPTPLPDTASASNQSFRLGYGYSPRPIKSPISPPSTSQLKAADFKPTTKTLSPINPLWSASRKSGSLPQAEAAAINVMGGVSGSIYPIIVDEPRYSLSVKSAALSSSLSSSPLPPPTNIVNPPSTSAIENESIRQSKRFSKTFGIELDDY